MVEVIVTVTPMVNPIRPASGDKFMKIHLQQLVSGHILEAKR
jgi:hypothetical protein